MSNITSTCDSGSFSTEKTREVQHYNSHNTSTTTTTNNNSNGSNTNSQPPPPLNKKKRSLPGNPDPSAEVIALSPTTLMATNRFLCEICNKGFQRDQNLQLHRRGHNLPWKLKQRATAEVRKRVYVCPVASCVHHNPARALGDLTGIKKHFCRKHGEKKWKCDKCSKKYAVQSDWKAHSKICGTREYKCDCGTIFSRRDSFITHRAFCDALAQENTYNQGLAEENTYNQGEPHLIMPSLQQSPNMVVPSLPTTINNNNNNPSSLQVMSSSSSIFQGSISSSSPSPHIMSATALLQKAAQMGATVSNSNNSGGGSATISNSNNSGGGIMVMENNAYATTTTRRSMMAPPSYSGLVVQQNVHGEFMKQFMQNNNVQHDHYSLNGNIIGMNNGVDMFNTILDQSTALSKIIDQNNNRTGGGSSGGAGGGATNKGSSGGGDVMTLDLLGIGGGGGGGVHGGGFYGGFESFSATSSI